ncbi:MAG: MerC domain-containing protein [Pseudomonadota bacterium]
MSTAVSSDRADFIAAGLSAACLVHCLALPILSAAAPIFASWADVEWVHKLFVLLAAPVSLSTVFLRIRRAGGIIFSIAACAGLLALLAAAFFEPAHDHERLLTAIGGFVLGGAHLVWWLRHRPPHQRSATEA